MWELELCGCPQWVKLVRRTQGPPHPQPTVFWVVFFYGLISWTVVLFSQLFSWEDKKKKHFQYQEGFLLLPGQEGRAEGGGVGWGWGGYE